MTMLYENNQQYQKMQDYKASYLLSFNPYQSSSIDGILDQEGSSLANKLNITASIISDRLKLNQEHYNVMTYNWLETKNRLHELDPAFRSSLKDSSRQVSALEGQLTNISSEIIKQKIQCWKDLVEPMASFLDLYDRYQQHKMTKNMLGDSE